MLESRNLSFFHFKALYGITFPAAGEAAFSNYRLWESVGFILAFGLHDVLGIQVKFAIQTGVLVLGIMGMMDFLESHASYVAD